MKITNQSYVKVTKCSESHHNGMTGHVISKRLKGGYNLKLTNHENCSAKEVEVLVLHRVRKTYTRQHRTFLQNLAMSLYWNSKVFGF